MARGTPGQLALGPGTLFVGELGTTEPTDLSNPGNWAAISTGWKGPWYTDTGSEFHYTIATEQVTVAEELDPLSNPATGRTASVSFAFAEITASNMMRAMNAPTSAIVAGSGIVSIEPPDFGTEVRRMVGWESEDHTERWIFRQCFQTGDATITRAKGAAKATIAMQYTLEKPTTGARLYRVIMATARTGT
jgi:hypothetical protein